ncbi:hypothetical protein PENTCL1PPCAC_3001, partial [Pristionchus entomophagus]
IGGTDIFGILIIGTTGKIPRITLLGSLVVLFRILLIKAPVTALGLSVAVLLTHLRAPAEIVDSIFLNFSRSLGSMFWLEMSAHLVGVFIGAYFPLPLSCEIPQAIQVFGTTFLGLSGSLGSLVDCIVNASLIALGLSVAVLLARIQAPVVDSIILNLSRSLVDRTRVSPVSAHEILANLMALFIGVHYHLVHASIVVEPFFSLRGSLGSLGSLFLDRR